MYAEKLPGGEDPEVSLYQFMKENKTKWKRGLYVFIRSYIGFYGVYEYGKVYKLSSKLAKLFGNSGDIRPVPKVPLKEKIRNFFSAAK